MAGFLNLILGYFAGGFYPYIRRIHTAYIGEDSSILGTWNVWWFNSIFGQKLRETNDQ